MADHVMILAFGHFEDKLRLIAAGSGYCRRLTGYAANTVDK